MEIAECVEVLICENARSGRDVYFVVDGKIVPTIYISLSCSPNHNISAKINAELDNISTIKGLNVDDKRD